MRFEWNNFWTYYDAATKGRNKEKVNLMKKGVDATRTQYWGQLNGALHGLSVERLVNEIGMTKYCSVTKTHMMSLGLSQAMTTSVLNQFKKYYNTIL